jgi:hypothetical protein
MSDYSFVIAQDDYEFPRCDICGFRTPRSWIEYDVCISCRAEEDEDASP